MKKTSIEAAVLLKDTLKNEEKIDAPLFSSALQELDDLSKKLAQIPVDVDASASRFQKITTQAVDDFVTVANETLSKFMQRTTEMKAVLDAIERIGRTATSQAATSTITPAPVKSNNTSVIADALWWAVPLAILCSIVTGATIAYFILK